MDMTPKRSSESATEMVQVVLPNDANPLGFILGGTVMHLIDIAGAIACHRHTRSLLVTAAVDDLQFLHSIKVGDLIILKAHVTCVFTTSLEVQVDVFSEETLGSLRDADPESHAAVIDSFARWDAIEIRYRDEVIRSRGHAFTGIGTVPCAFGQRIEISVGNLLPEGDGALNGGLDALQR